MKTQVVTPVLWTLLLLVGSAASPSFGAASSCLEAKAHLDAGRAGEAVAAASACIERSRSTGDAKEALVLRAAARLEAGDAESALGDTIEAARREIDPSLLIEYAVKARLAKRYQESLAALEAFRRMRGAIGRTPVVSMLYHYHRALALRESGQTKAAIDELTLGLIDQPEHGLALVERARAWDALGQADMAMMDAFFAVAAMPAGGFDEPARLFIAKILPGVPLDPLEVPSPPRERLTLGAAVRELESALRRVTLPPLPNRASEPVAFYAVASLADANNEGLGLVMYSAIELVPGVRYWTHSAVTGEHQLFKTGVSAGPIGLAYGTDWTSELIVTGALYSPEEGFTGVVGGENGYRESCRPRRKDSASSFLPALRGSVVALECKLQFEGEEPTRRILLWLDAYGVYLPLLNGAMEGGAEERRFMWKGLHAVLAGPTVATDRPARLCRDRAYSSQAQSREPWM